MADEGSDPLKVLYLINSLGGGGTERSLADLLPGLRASGVDAYIIVLESRGQEGVEHELRAMGFDIQVISTSGAVRTVGSIRKEIKRFRPCVVHTMLYRSNLLGRLAAIGLRVPVLVSLVTTTYSPARLSNPLMAKWKLRLLQVLDIGLAHFCTTRFHAVSDAVKADARSGLRLKEGKVTVIHRGRRIDSLPEADQRRRLAARASLAVSQDAELLVTVGRQEYAKGQIHLLGAMGLLSERSAAQLLVAGREGNETTKLREFVHAELAAGPTIRFLGHRPDIPEILAAADVFVFPSLFEGMPGAILEAMATGVPIVASDIPAVQEIVRETGCAVLVPPANPAALASAIRELLEDPERRRNMGSRGRLEFEARFTMDASTQWFLELYSELLHVSSSR